MAFVVVSLLAVSGCKKDADGAPAGRNKSGETAKTEAPKVASDGSRIVSMEAASLYKPSVIKAAPNEKLTLAITRTSDGCIEDFRMPDGKSVKLPKNQVVEISVTAPASGEWNFGCDMEHCHEGKIVVQ